MSRTLARFLSYLLHPLLMPTLGIALFFQLGTYHRYAMPDKAIWFIHGSVFLNTFVIPAGLAFFMWRRKLISSLHLPERDERLWPFLFALLFFVFNYFSLKRANLPWPVTSLMFGCALAVAAALVINLRWKISIHLIGMGGLAGGTFALSQIFLPDPVRVMWLLIATVITAGLLASARLKLDAHHPTQLYAGFALGFLAEFLPVSYQWG